MAAAPDRDMAGPGTTWGQDDDYLEGAVPEWLEDYGYVGRNVKRQSGKSHRVLALPRMARFHLCVS